MHVGAILVLCRDAVDGARELAIDQNDALVALADIGEIALGDERLAKALREELNERAEILVLAGEAEDAGAAIAVKRFQDDLAMLARNAASSLGSRVINVAGMRSGNCIT